MSENPRIEDLEKDLDQALKMIASLETRLGDEASQRISANEALSRRVKDIEMRVVD